MPSNMAFLPYHKAIVHSYFSLLCRKVVEYSLSKRNFKHIICGNNGGAYLQENKKEISFQAGTIPCPEQSVPSPEPIHAPTHQRPKGKNNCSLKGDRICEDQA
jgi:hypothetical protein